MYVQHQYYPVLVQNARTGGTNISPYALRRNIFTISSRACQYDMLGHWRNCMCDRVPKSYMSIATLQARLANTTAKKNRITHILNFQKEYQYFALTQKFIEASQERTLQVTPI